MHSTRILYKVIRIKNTVLLLISGVMAFVSHQAYSQTWSSLSTGMNDWVYASTIYNGDLIVGGKFTSAGGVSANHIARWDGSSWSPLGSGVNGKVNALIVYEGNLVAAGEFTSADGIDVNFIAQWDGTSWNDELGGVGSTVTSLAVVGNDLFAGGYFTEADNTPVNYIAKRDTAGWVSLGGGMSGQVMALTVHNGELYAGGFFTMAGGQNANHIAKWDGTAWSPLGSGISNIVYTLSEYNGDLIAGGLFLSAGGISANHIAAWNGTSWSALGSGMSGTFYQYVFALAVYNGKLIAGGYFTESGGITTNGIAQWDGSAWSGMAGGLFYPGNVFGTHTLCLYGTDLIVGGLFYSAGTTNAWHIASWNEITPVFKTLTVTAFLEGLYAGAGLMNPAMDGNTGLPQYGPDIADLVTLELHNDVTYETIEYTSGLVDLSTSGNIAISTIPDVLSGSYYITIKHRNSIETTTAAPVSFAGSTINYDFSIAAAQAFGNNMKLMGSVFAIWGADVNQDGLVDSGDMNPIENASVILTAGYVVEDVNGDGLVDSSDMNIVENNSIAIVTAITP